MASKKYCIIAVLAIVVMMVPVGSTVVGQEYSSGLHTGWMLELGGNNITYNRTYEYYIPSSYDGSEAVPLLFSFHGLGSDPEGQIELTSFDALAEQEGFIAVFPKATALDAEDYPDCAQYLPALPGANIMWNIGLNWTLQYCADIDDVGFVSDMVDWFETNYNIDEGLVYATGMSNGAMFTYYVALMLPGTFAGIAPVCSPMTVNGFEFEDVPPLTVIMMMSPTDPIVDYDGSAYAYGSMDDTVDFWLNVGNITSEPVETLWSDDGIDSTTITRYVYSGGTAGTQVIFFKVEGNQRGFPVGHTWPGGPQYLEPLFIGSVSNQIDGSAFIWKHLPPGKYYLTIHSTKGGSVTTPIQKTLFYEPSSSATQVSLTAVPNSGYEFVSWTWTLNDGTIEDANSAETTITITPDRDYEIKANFQLKSEEEPEPTPSGGMCFIATAAYGTSTAKQVDVLRDFRDDVLLKSAVGSRLVDLYYQVSPPIADFISEHNFASTLVRELLIDPVVWLVKATGDFCRN